MHYATWRKYGDPLHPVKRRFPPGTICSIEDCGERATRRGMCDTHRRREEKHGETTEPRERKFWAKVDKNGPVPEHRPELGPCWVWTGYVHPKTGYGQFGMKEGTRLPHRIAYQYLIGPIPEGMHLDHLCSNRRCVNAERHLEPVSPRENIRRGEQGAFWGYQPDAAVLRAPQQRPITCVNGCPKAVYKRDICRPCYRKWLKDPNVVRPSTMTAEDRFWAKVDKNGPVPGHRPDLGQCWVWTAGINAGTGYGSFRFQRGHGVDAHRYSYLLAHGEIPEGFHVHHECHTRHCVRPEHLLALPVSENVRRRKVRRDPAQMSGS